MKELKSRNHRQYTMDVVCVNEDQSELHTKRKIITRKDWQVQVHWYALDKNI